MEIIGIWTKIYAYVWNTANGLVLYRSNGHLVCVSLIASHVSCAHTNYYICNCVTTICKPGYKWFVTQAVAFGPSTHINNYTRNSYDMSISFWSDAGNHNDKDIAT